VPVPDRGADPPGLGPADGRADSGPDSGSVFRGITDDVLRDTGKLRSWFEWQLAPPSPLTRVLDESQWEDCVAAAEAALAKGKNPHRMFGAVAGRGNFSKISKA